jgi:hypothetical protein
MSTGNSLLAWTNHAKAASITATSAATNLPASNAGGDSGAAASGWQTVYGVTTATLTVTPALTGRTWDVIGLFRTNITALATVTVTLYTNPSTSVWTTTLAGPNGNGQVIALPPAATVADYATIAIADASNPDGFLNVPLMFGGPAFRPAGSASYASTVGRDATVAEATSRGGQEYPTLYYQRRRWNVQFDSLRSAEVLASVDPLASYAAAGSNVLFVPDVTNSYVQSEALFGRLKQTADVSYPYQAADRRRASFAVTERL